MLRDDELQPQETSQISYKDYKKIVNSTKKHDLRLFLWVFFVLLLVFLGLAKTVSPDVDITLGDEQSEYSDENMEAFLTALDSEAALSSESLKRLFG